MIVVTHGLYRSYNEKDDDLSIYPRPELKFDNDFMKFKILILLPPPEPRGKSNVFLN